MLTNSLFAGMAAVILLAGMAQPARAADYETANPCASPAEHVAPSDVVAPDVATSAGQPPVTPSYTATVDLRLPLSSRIDTAPYNADLSAAEIDAGTAMVTEKGSYINVLGNEIPPPPEEKNKGCR